VVTLYDTVREGNGTMVAEKVLITTCTDPDGSKLSSDIAKPVVSVELGG